MTDASEPRSVGWKRLDPVGCFLGLLFVVALVSQLRIQVVSARSTVDKAEQHNRFTSFQKLAPVRGRILSADHQILAQDEDSASITLNYQKSPRSRGFFTELGAATGVPADELAAHSGSPAASASWVRPLGEADRRLVAGIRSAWGADGLSVVTSSKRTYPFDEITAGITGYARPGFDKKGKDAIISMGLERSYRADIEGKPGVKRGMTDRKGDFLPNRVVEDRPAQNGRDIVLTIDSAIQSTAYAALRDTVVKNGASAGAAVVMDPKTGDILAMANYPSLKLNRPDPKDPNAAGFNHAIQGMYEPGSTFKILTLAKALDEGKVSMDETITCGGVLQINNRSRIRCDMHNGSRVHGRVDPVKAIAVSCNVSAATWARRVGRDRFLHYIDQLGLTQRPGTGLPMEGVALLNRDDPAQQLQLANLGFGQAINPTPVGITSAFSMLANGGIRMRPRLIKSVGDEENPPRRIGDRIVSEETAHEVLRAMAAVVQTREGTGWKLAIPGYEIGGKTGTAQLLARHMKGYRSNFVGTVPARDPRAVIYVVVDRPTKAKYGGAVAGPAFRSIALSVIRRFAIPPDPSIKTPQNPRGEN